MQKTALFIRHQAHPGKRDDVRRVWEKHVKPRVATNPTHEAYFFCYDNSDPDIICVFQLYTDLVSMQDFLKGPWYSDYLNEVGQFVAVPPLITPATLVWAKE
jgi:quinol monooxygenase YgiN